MPDTIRVQIGKNAYKTIYTIEAIEKKIKEIPIIIGPKGDTGLQGVAGQSPIKGIDYFDGLQGIQGVQGIQGDPGYTPVKGIDYFDGVKGDTGTQGIQGERGLQGEQGIQGISGNDAEVTNANVISAIGFTPVNTIDSRLSDARTPINHNLVNTTQHPVSGLTAGHVLKALSATTYGFGALPTSTTSQQGVVELATLSEVGTGTDTIRAVTPQGLNQEINKCAKQTQGISLPVASVIYRGQYYLLQGGTGVADKQYYCMKKADDSYVWLEVFTFRY